MLPLFSKVAECGIVTPLVQFRRLLTTRLIRGGSVEYQREQRMLSISSLRIGCELRRLLWILLRIRGSGGGKLSLKVIGYFNTEFIYTESVMPGEIAEMDFDAFMKSSPDFALGALRADTGDMTWWRRDDVQTLEQLSAYTRASSTIPFFMPVAHVDGHEYYDGAMGPTGGFAYDAAIEDGYSKFLFILTRPKSFRREPMSQTRLIRSYFRKQPAVAEAILQRAEHYNHSKEKIAQWEKEGRAMVFYPDQMPVHNKERNVEKLQKSYEMGVDQVAREWPRWEEFLRG